MPELPEVETVKKVLTPIVKNQTITKIDVFRDKTIEGNVQEFKKALTGQTFLNVSRIGKYLIFELTNDLVIISHLRMEGKYYEFLENEENSKYVKVVFHLSNGHKVCYDDSRAFGIMKLSNIHDYKNEEMIDKLGPEPFDVNDVSFIMKNTKKMTLPIKTALLSQTLVTGLGNIYVDEVLYASKIHPLTPAKYLTKKDWENVISNSKEILNIAIEMGGSTIKSYHPGKDIDGNFQTRIKIYGKSGETCPNCGHTFRFIKVGGRGTTFCPTCQRKVGAPINVAITGKIASGKSFATSTFKELGAVTLSSDEIISKLYEDEKVASLIEKSLGLKFSTSTVNKKELRDNLLLNPNNKKKLERIVHPLVEKEIVKFLKKEKSQIRVVEIPLLFEAKLDHYFDTIIVIDVNEKMQKEHIEKRDPSKAMYLLEINKTNIIDENKLKATYIIENNSKESDYKKKLVKVFNELQDLIK